jgi:hypothetical protein
MKQSEIIYVRHNRGIIAPKISPTHIGFCELTIVFDGALEYTVGDTLHRLTAGDVLFLPQGSLRARSVLKETADYISFNFLSSEEVRLPCVLKGAVSSEILLLVAAYDKMETRTSAGHTEKYAHLLSCILSVLEETAANAQISPLTRKIMEYIHSDLRRKVILEDIGRLTFFSPFDVIFNANRLLVPFSMR